MKKSVKESRLRHLGQTTLRRTKKVVKFIAKSIAIFTVAFVIASPTIALLGNVELLGKIERKISVMDFKYEYYIRALSNLVYHGFIDQMETNKEVEETLDMVIRSLQSKRSIDVKQVARIKDANILIGNVTQKRGGSGTHILINGKSYILSCAHLIKKDTDEMRGYLDNKKYVDLEIVKYDVKNDLALFKPIKTLKGLVETLEISDVEPKEGSAVIVVGNPSGMVDVITEGVVATKRKGYYIFTNLIYFGNSGGALLYKGKIVGIVTNFRVFYKPPVYVNYGYARDLSLIKAFLKDAV